MKQRLYLDTSVFGGFFDEEFAEFTKPFFERLQKKSDPPGILCYMEKTIKKTFDAVEFMREQRKRLSVKLSEMTKEEIIEYFRKKKFENFAKPCG